VINSSPLGISTSLVNGPVQLSGPQSEAKAFWPGMEVLVLPVDPLLLFDGLTEAPKTIVLAHGTGIRRERG
jgi:hypothetical protein